MGPDGVVFLHPHLSDFPDFGQAAEQIKVEHLLSVSAVESLDVSILSITGSTVYHNSNFESGQAIDLSSLSSGPYVLRIKGGKGLFNTMIQKL